jgi:hypothetical protein
MVSTPACPTCEGSEPSPAPCSIRARLDATVKPGPAGSGAAGDWGLLTGDWIIGGLHVHVHVHGVDGWLDGWNGLDP